MTELPKTEGAISTSSLVVETRELGRGCEEKKTPPRPGSFHWTDEAISKLNGLAATKTIPEIARILGTTRNAVVGKAYRLGISFPVFREKCETSLSAISDMLAAGMRPPQIARELGESPNTIHGKIRYLRRRGQVTTKELPNKQEPVGCRYITGDVPGDWGYCQKPGDPWCPEHRGRVFQKPGQVAAPFKPPTLTTMDK